MGAGQVKERNADADSALARQIGELEKTKERLLCEKEALVSVDVRWLRDSAMLSSRPSCEVHENIAKTV